MYRDLLTLSQTAAAALAAGQLVGFDGRSATAGGRVLGVATCDAGMGDDFSVGVCGVFMVSAGAAISRGQRLMADASGRAVTCGSDPAAAFGEALTDAVPGQKVRVLFR